MGQAEHSKIINKVARKLLKPMGLVRKGQSRTWLDDRGWFATMVEYQPFKDRRGTCINVGVNFHWYPNSYWSFDMGYRESDFVDFEEESRFTLEVEKLTETALEKVFQYREGLKSIAEAKPFILNHVFTSERLWGSYHKGIICGLNGDTKNMHFYFDRLLALELNAPFEKELEHIVVDLKRRSSDLNLFKNAIDGFIQESRREKKCTALATYF